MVVRSPSPIEVDRDAWGGVAGRVTESIVADRPHPAVTARTSPTRTIVNRVAIGRRYPVLAHSKRWDTDRPWRPGHARGTIVKEAAATGFVPLRPSGRRSSGATRRSVAGERPVTPATAKPDPPGPRRGIVSARERAGGPTTGGWS